MRILPLLFVIPSGAACPAKEVHNFSLSASGRGDYVLPFESLKDRDNHLALSDLGNFIAKIGASLVTRFKGH